MKKYELADGRMKIADVEYRLTTDELPSGQCMRTDDVRTNIRQEKLTIRMDAETDEKTIAAVLNFCS